MNTLVALPIAAALPVAAPAMAPSRAPKALAFVDGEPADPIFEAIAKHKKALRAARAAGEEIDRLMGLADAAVGPCSIQVPDMRVPTNSPPKVTVSCWIDIEKYISSETYPELYVLYYAKSVDQHATHAKYLEEIAGDIDEIMDRPAGEELEAADELAETVPTSLAGLLAMLTYVNKAMTTKNAQCEGSFDETNMRSLFGSLAKAAKALARQPARVTRPTPKTSSDPVFGLIAAHRKAEANHNRLVDIHGFDGVSITEKSFADVRNSFMAVVEAAATTRPGLVAKATYLQNLARREAWMFEQVDPVAVQLVEGFAASIENVSSDGLGWTRTGAWGNPSDLEIGQVTL